MNAKVIGVVYNATKPEIGALVGQVQRTIEQLGCEAVVVPGSAQRMDPVDAVVVLGGDGTFLRAARLVTSLRTPLLGVDLGTLGFLAEVSYPDLAPGLERLVSGDYTIEERPLMEVALVRDGRVVASELALNEGVVLKGASGRMLEAEVFADASHVATYGADGFIVSTPTGSTAYAMAAHGPIMAPDVPAFIFVPICPHTLTARPLVLSDERTVRIVVKERAEGAILTADGRTVGHLQPGDAMTFRRSEHVTRMVRLSARDFFTTLRRKLQWGDRLRSDGAGGTC
ncbi:putative inorganic polyphosphate/ATP-NAD kinase [compost metagenome]